MKLIQEILGFFEDIKKGDTFVKHEVAQDFHDVTIITVLDIQNDIVSFSIKEDWIGGSDDTHKCSISTFKSMVKGFKKVRRK